MPFLPVNLDSVTSPASFTGVPPATSLPRHSWHFPANCPHLLSISHQPLSLPVLLDVARLCRATVPNASSCFPLLCKKVSPSYFGAYLFCGPFKSAPDLFFVPPAYFGTVTFVWCLLSKRCSIPAGSVTWLHCPV